MIQNANNTKLNNINSNLPNMADTIVGWFLNVTFDVVERTMSGADWVNSITKTIKTKGVVQPASEEALKVLPEGCWSFEPLTLHCLPNVQLNTNQYIVYDNKTYKIMGRKNYEKYGFCRYTIIESWKVDNQ